MSPDTSSEFVRGLIAILRDRNVALHPTVRLSCAEALEQLLWEQESWAEGGAAEFLAELQATGWHPTYNERASD